MSEQVINNRIFISAKQFGKLSKRDLENGAVQSEIYNTLKQREQLEDAMDGWHKREKELLVEINELKSNNKTHA